MDVAFPYINTYSFFWSVMINWQNEMHPYWCLNGCNLSLNESGLRVTQVDLTPLLTCIDSMVLIVNDIAVQTHGEIVFTLQHMEWAHNECPCMGWGLVFGDEIGWFLFKLRVYKNFIHKVSFGLRFSSSSTLNFTLLPQLHWGPPSSIP